MAVDIGEMLDRLLTEDARHRDDTHDYRLTRIPLGDAAFPTGRVVGCDPLVHPGQTPPFTVTVPPGRYRLQAWVAVVHPAAARHGAGPSAAALSGAAGASAARAGTGLRTAAGAGLPSAPAPGGTRRRRVPESDRRTAALHLVLRDEPVVAWEPAELPDAHPALLDEDGFFAYPVDSGLGTLADESALTALRAWDYARVERTFLPEPSPPAPGFVRAVTRPATGAAVVAVTTGWGDGAYATFIGRTVHGQVAALVTDFRVI